MTHDREALDLEAMRALGKPYSECSLQEIDAVQLAVTAHRLIDRMRPGETIGDAVARQRAEADEDKP